MKRVIMITILTVLALMSSAFSQNPWTNTHTLTCLLTYDSDSTTTNSTVVRKQLMGVLPRGSIILEANVWVETAFSGGSTPEDSLAIGTLDDIDKFADLIPLSTAGAVHDSFTVVTNAAEMDDDLESFVVYAFYLYEDSAWPTAGEAYVTLTYAIREN